MATDRRWVIFDTSIYVGAIRAGLSSRFAERLQDELPRSYLSAVVVAELRAGATDDVGRRVVHGFTMWAHRVGRVVTPTAASWEQAGDVLARIRAREPGLGSRLGLLWNDLLIALSSRQIGARVVTADARDFELLGRYIRIDLEVVAEP
jgi:predicted nucleic acid-binding protein